jgi:SAM-dependent methyltransferase
MAAREERHFWYRALHAKVAQALRAADLGPAPLVVDVGCGTGGMGRALTLALPGCRRVGLDYAARALELARGSGFLGLAAADANALPLRDGCADAAVCLDVLSCRGVDPKLALAEIRRCLKTGGTAVLNVPAFPALRGRHDAAADVHRRLVRGELTRLLSEAGLEPRSVRYWNTALAAGMLAWRGVSRLIPGEPVSDVGLTPPALDAFLAAFLRAEWALTRALPVPFGASLLAVARRL